MSRIRDDYDKSFIRAFRNWLENGGSEAADLLENKIPEQKKQTVVNLSTEETENSVYDERFHKRLSGLNRLYKIVSVILCLVIIASLLYTIAFMPRFGSQINPTNNEVSQRYISEGLEETGAVNAITGMILDYRAFDTFGETCVLFAATICVQILLSIDEGTILRRKSWDGQVDDRTYETHDDIILQNVSKVLVPMIFMFGIYTVLNGHIYPGGGFSGGAIIGAGLILYQNAFGFKKTERFFTDKTFKGITLSALTFYCLAKSYSFYTGANGLHSIISNGTPGRIFSSGLILPLNICVGAIVASTIYSFYALFRKGGL